MYRSTLSPIALLLVVALAGCKPGSLPMPAPSHPRETVGDLVEYLAAKGYKGEFSVMFASVIGAEEGGRLEGKGFSVEIYRFKDVNRASSLAKTGFSKDNKVFANGPFVLSMDAAKVDDKLVASFKSF